MLPWTERVGGFFCARALRGLRRATPTKQLLANVCGWNEKKRSRLPLNVVCDGAQRSFVERVASVRSPPEFELLLKSRNRKASPLCLLCAARHRRPVSLVCREFSHHSSSPLLQTNVLMCLMRGVVSLFAFRARFIFRSGVVCVCVFAQVAMGAKEIMPVHLPGRRHILHHHPSSSRRSRSGPCDLSFFVRSPFSQPHRQEEG